MDLVVEPRAGPEALEDLDAGLAARGLSPKTRAHVQATMKTFYRWLVQRQDVAQMPSFPTITVPDREPRVLEPEDQRRVLDAISDERRGIFLALAYHGIRFPSASANFASWTRRERVKSLCHHAPIATRGSRTTFDWVEPAKLARISEDPAKNCPHCCVVAW
jgi:hypothetical protein